MYAAGGRPRHRIQFGALVIPADQLVDTVRVSLSSRNHGSGMPGLFSAGNPTVSTWVSNHISEYIIII
eukprot:204460-Hanusia_phi.AAC.5